MFVCLVGLPGSGKSTVGKQLARRLGCRFIDTDALIERRIGEPIRSFFERYGEDTFRDVEEQVISEVVIASDDQVIATGGGAVLRPINRQRLHASSTVVYLRSTPEDLARRLRNDTQRPLLAVSDPLGRLRELYAQRDPLYREVAHFIVDTGRPSVATLVNTVLMQLELSGGAGSHTRSTPTDGPNS